jgi:hypothetical protein
MQEVFLSYSTQVLRICVILLVAWLLQLVAARLIRVFRAYMASRTEISRIEIPYPHLAIQRAKPRAA